MNNEIIKFVNGDLQLDVAVSPDNETVWLSQKQMAELFNKDRRTITRHIQNIFKSEELDKNSVCSFFEHTASDGKTYKIQYYNSPKCLTFTSKKAHKIAHISTCKPRFASYFYQNVVTRFHDMYFSLLLINQNKFKFDKTSIYAIINSEKLKSP